MGEGGLRSVWVGGVVRAIVMAFRRGGVEGELEGGVWVVVCLDGGGFRKVVLSMVRSNRVVRSWSSKGGSVVYSGLVPYERVALDQVVWIAKSSCMQGWEFLSSFWTSLPVRGVIERWCDLRMLIHQWRSIDSQEGSWVMGGGGRPSGGRVMCVSISISSRMIWMIRLK